MSDYRGGRMQTASEFLAVRNDGGVSTTEGEEEPTEEDGRRCRPMPKLHHAKRIRERKREI